jgi:hypothetical protein
VAQGIGPEFKLYYQRGEKKDTHTHMHTQFKTITKWMIGKGNKNCKTSSRGGSKLEHTSNHGKSL